jgi:hydrogenase/urease accessory protein HupE
MIFRFSLKALITLWTVICSPLVLAHNFSPSLLEIVEEGNGSYHALIKQSPKQADTERITPVFPPHCKRTGEISRSRTTGYQLTEMQFDCGIEGLSLGPLGADGLGDSNTSVVLRLLRADGGSFSAVLNRNRTRVDIPENPSNISVFRDYFLLGANHLIVGMDHLLFLFALVLLVQHFKPLVAVVTAFTLGHATSVVAVSLGLFSVASHWVEVFIALSIILLAMDVYLKNKNQPGTRYLVLLCVAFGILHGMGFASALEITNLATSDKAVALLSFNLGIEAVQVAVVLFLGTLLYILFGLLHIREPGVLKPAGVALGAIAGMWLWERLVISAAALNLL